MNSVALASNDTTAALAVVKAAKLTRLPDLIEQFEAAEALHLPDQVVPFTALAMTPEGTIEVGGSGSFDMTPWARKQLSSLIGVRWDRWFATADAEERADEVNRRFTRTPGQIRVRTARPTDDIVVGDGVLRAFVGPRFSPIADSQVARSLMDALVGTETDLVVQRSDTTDMSSSYTLKLGRPFRPNGNRQVGDVWGALTISNSDVGWACLDVSLSLLRLACLNGMVVADSTARLLHKKHLGIDPNEIAVVLHEGLAGVGEKLMRGARRMADATAVTVRDVEAEVRRFLTDARLPLRLAEPMMDAYRAEPMPSAFGVSQAATLLAQSRTPEERLALERAAGRYLARLAN